jgi:hypothetical protein
MIRIALIVGLAAASLVFNGGLRAASFPEIPAWTPDPVQRENLRRSLTLLNSSTPEKRNTVLVLFYGQSITQQAWWKDVESYLRATYTNANLIVENRSIGGHSSQLLVKTAEADLYPFQPDLVVFHVYGSHIEYENIIRRVRERTCADILLQTDHINQDASLTEEMDPAKLTPKQWDAWMNRSFLPTVAAKYAACRANIHELWKAYLQEHHLKAAALLADGVHLNPQGCWLMAQLLNAYLAPLPPKPGYDPYNDSRVRTLSPTISDDGKSAKVEFTGTRADILFNPAAKGRVDATIDGRKPSESGFLYGFTRVSAFPNSDWPILLKINAQSPLVAEEWSLQMDQIAADGKRCHFRLHGSVTGDDGEGVSTNRFVSKSGRIVIEPEDWNLGYCVAVFKRALPEGHTAAWKAVLRGVDTAEAPAARSGVESTVTIAQCLAPGKHTLELRGQHLGELLRGVRIFEPK